MDGEKNGKPYLLMEDSGENPLFSETLICRVSVCVIGISFISEVPNPPKTHILKK